MFTQRTVVATSGSFHVRASGAPVWAPNSPNRIVMSRGWTRAEVAWPSAFNTTGVPMLCSRAAQIRHLGVLATGARHFLRPEAAAQAEFLCVEPSFGLDQVGKARRIGMVVERTGDDLRRNPRQRRQLQGTCFERECKQSPQRGNVRGLTAGWVAQR